MKHLLILIIAGIALVLSSCTHSPEEILKKSWTKCQSVENGYYEMDHFMKYMSRNDTTQKTFKCHFKKLPGDTLFSSVFHYEQTGNEGSLSGVLYSGNEFVTYNPGDSSGTIRTTGQWADQIERIKHNYTFYKPFFHHKSFPVNPASDNLPNEYTYQLLGQEEVNGFECYHILKLMDTAGQSHPGLRSIRMANQIWINKEDYIPVQYTSEYTFIEMDVDTVTQFEKNLLTKYEINKLKDTSRLSLSSIPGFIRLKDYVPSKRPDLLDAGTIAPVWSLTSLEGKTINLADLKGKLVLIDFFYKSCHPCMLALPGLQRLNEKYDEDGLLVIGINPFDTKEEDGIDEFLKKRGITYTVLLSDRSVPEDYHVSGYPTMYLIGRDGRIIHTQVGYGESTEEELEKVILEHL
jgi:peroxiredoxin